MSVANPRCIPTRNLRNRPRAYNVTIIELFEFGPGRYDTTRNGATFSASKFSPIARAMNRAVIGVPS